MDLDPMPQRRGRAAADNPPNRFERLHHVEDPAALGEDDLRQVPTVFFRDHARSILARNDSPDLPFRYSLNPYRGCEHGCAYCLSGDTPILMADGRTKPLAELRVGDAIYGTERRGWYRRHVKTRVLDHWVTRKPAFRLTLADGTTLVASGDHRFLTERGWKYVTGTQQGTGRRPHLTLNNALMGPGAITRKRDIEGLALKSGADLRVVEIEPLGREIELFDITTGTGDFIANGVVSHNCYARPSHEYLGFSAGLDFETKILVKEDAPALLREAFRKPGWEPQVVLISGNTDCYQPVERRLALTRRCLEVFLEFRNPVSIITKNHLVTRDLDLLAELAALDLVRVTLSITSLRDDVIHQMEPRTSRPARRLTAIERLAEAGVPVGVNAAPLIPGLTDEELPAILEAAAERGARWAGYGFARLPGPVKPIFLAWVERAFPDRADRIKHRLEDVWGPEMNDPRFGHRMRGQGTWAATVHTLFGLTCRRLGLNAERRALSTAHFRRSPPGQMELF